MTEDNIRNFETLKSANFKLGSRN